MPNKPKFALYDKVRIIFAEKDFVVIEIRDNADLTYVVSRIGENGQNYLRMDLTVKEEWIEHAQ